MRRMLATMLLDDDDGVHIQDEMRGRHERCLHVVTISKRASALRLSPWSPPTRTANRDDVAVAATLSLRVRLTWKRPSPAHPRAVLWRHRALGYGR